MRFRNLIWLSGLLFTNFEVLAQVPPHASPNYTGGWNCNLGYHRSGDRCEKTAVPANASPNYTGGWNCDLGYHRSGDRCEKTAVPANASPNYTGGWNCDLGFKKVGKGCVQMSSEELAEQQRMIALIRARQRASQITYNDESFTLRDVERKCEAYVYDRENGDLECRSPLRFLGRRCTVYIDSWPDGSISCRGSELRLIERQCSVSMYSEDYGEIGC